MSGESPGSALWLFPTRRAAESFRRQAAAPHVCTLQHFADEIVRQGDPAARPLSQAQRRVIVEERSRHIAIGLDYLPAIARRLHHCRDLGAAQPFDFLAWFEYSPDDEAAFEALLAKLRASEEWRFVEREVDVRVARYALDGATCRAQ